MFGLPMLSSFSTSESGHMTHCPRTAVASLSNDSTTFASNSQETSRRDGESSEENVFITCASSRQIEGMLAYSSDPLIRVRFSENLECSCGQASATSNGNCYKPTSIFIFPDVSFDIDVSELFKNSPSIKAEDIVSSSSCNTD